MTDVLQVEDRELSGKQNNRRLRRSGRLPVVLYGHNEAVISLSVGAEELHGLIRHGVKVVDLEGAASGQALFQELQWDTFMQQVLHVDLLRVDASERVNVEIPLVLRGDAPGARSGGVVDQTVRFVQIETSPSAMPENLHVNVNSLELGDSLTLADIEDLPEGASLIASETTVVVQCVEPVADREEDELAGGTVEPEVIGRKDEEGQDDGS